MNILVVEDDFISRRLLCRYLEKSGSCDVAINGNEAVAAVHDALDAGRHYDLICLDIMMPGMAGQEALTAIRQLEIEHDIQVGQGARVIMTTALDDHENVRLAFRHSADGYVVKPIEKQKLFRLLNELGLTTTVAV
jgi:two-component system chemotaxis response regulator CheY